MIFINECIKKRVVNDWFGKSWPVHHETIKVLTIKFLFILIYRKITVIKHNM